MYTVISFKKFQIREQVTRFFVNNKEEAIKTFHSEIYEGTNETTLEEFWEKYKDVDPVKLNYCDEWYGPNGHEHFVWIEDYKNMSFTLSFINDSEKFQYKGVNIEGQV